MEEVVHWEEAQDVAPWQKAEEEKVEEVAEEEEEEVATPLIRDDLRNIHSINIIQNHDFSRGLDSWEVFGDANSSVIESDGGSYAVVTNRTGLFEGLQQNITSRVSIGLPYSFSARVQVSGPFDGCQEVLATLKVDHYDNATTYHLISRIAVPNNQWGTLEGTFTLPKEPKKVVMYLEGPFGGVDLFIKSVLAYPSQGSSQSMSRSSVTVAYENVIANPRFDDGLNHWSGRGCNIKLNHSLADLKILPKSGKVFATTSNRTHAWNGIQQEITKRVQRNTSYELTVVVRIYGNNVTSANINAILWIQTPNDRRPATIASVQATNNDWAQLQGKFLINGSPSCVVIYLAGPPPGTDILINSLVVKRVGKKQPPSTPIIENAPYGVNIVQNEIGNEKNGWFSLGKSALSIEAGSPRILPPTAKESLGLDQPPLSGRHILVTNRTETWMGPAQIITNQVKLFLTYQVSGWVKIGSGGSSSSPQIVNITLRVDDQWVNVCQVNATSDTWHEIRGSFRIEEQASIVTVYVQVPSSRVNLMIADVLIFAVNRHARFTHLRSETDKTRKSDVVLKFSGGSSGSSVGSSTVKVKQTTNSFPLGSCVTRNIPNNEAFMSFFVNNFNWVVFSDEPKWFGPGYYDYQALDVMLDLFLKHNIQVRGHSIFTESEENLESWIPSLNKTDLNNAVQSRLKDVVTRYKGKLKHYDVNSGMLHGSFYKDRLGNDIRSTMFKTAKEHDPYAFLFVNDYHVEDGKDGNSTPEKYIKLILDLKAQGAPIGGIGIQGHIDSPVGPIVCSALDKLAVLGLPIWFTELDVSSISENVRADDLEVMLREAFAHPSVDGVVLSGFWEMLMTRENSHLVNAEGDLNEAGKRLLELKKEWTTDVDGVIDDKGEFRFRGFHGTYEVEVVTPANKVVKTKFVLDKADSPLVVNINI